MVPSVEAASGLVSWWPGDGNALDIRDSNNGTLRSGAGFAQGKVRRAFKLDGTNDFVKVLDSSNLDIGTHDFSLDAWVWTNVEDLQIIMDKRVGLPDTPHHPLERERIKRQTIANRRLQHHAQAA